MPDGHHFGSRGIGVPGHGGETCRHGHGHDRQSAGLTERTSLSRIMFFMALPFRLVDFLWAKTPAAGVYSLECYAAFESDSPARNVGAKRARARDPSFSAI